MYVYCIWLQLYGLKISNSAREEERKKESKKKQQRRIVIEYNISRVAVI